MKRSGILLWLAMIFIFIGCASYQARVAPIPQLEAMPYRSEVTNAVVSVDPYTQPERLEATFDGNLMAASVLPIQIVVENLGPKRLLVRPSDAFLELADGRQIPPAGAFAAASKMEKSGNVAAATICFGLLGYLASSHAEDKARGARLEDFRRKEFPEKKLEKAGSAHGFLYFLLPSGTQDLSAAKLAIRLVEVDEAKSSVVKVPLTGCSLPVPVK
jgi:hypothetical protein